MSAAPARALDLNALIEANVEKVTVIAWKVCRRLCGRIAIMEDLRGAGYVGLVQAARKYDGRSTTAFSTFCEYRIRGAMLDYVRSLDLATVSERNKGGVIDRRQVPIEGAGQIAARAKNLTARHDVERLLGQIRPRLAAVVRMRFFEDLSLDEIAARLGGVHSTYAGALVKRGLTALGERAGVR